jgi:hypothetical protein
MRKARDIHVLSSGSGWRVTQSGRTVSRHRIQRRAIASGLKVARRSGVDLVTHARDGRIRSKDSYGREGSARDSEH